MKAPRVAPREGHWKTETNTIWRDAVRRALQQCSIFYQKEKGKVEYPAKSLSISSMNIKPYGV